MKRLLLSVLLILLFESLVYASYQQSDVLIYKGKNYKMPSSSPLEGFYSVNKIHKLPQFWTEPNARFSGNDRGFVATWEIIHDKLFLTKIDSWFCGKTIRTKTGCRKVTLKDLLGLKIIKGKILASWFSGSLFVTDGKLLEYASRGNQPIYERPMVFNVVDGKVSAPLIIDYRKRFPKPIPSYLKLPTPSPPPPPMPKKP